MEKEENEDLSILGEYSQLVRLTDGKLISEDGSIFNIHKIVLVKKSVYFESMLCGLNKARTEFTVPEISGRCLAEVLRYIYTSEMLVTDENIAEILLASDYLIIPDTYREIKGRVKDHLTIANCLQLFEIANQIPCEEITRESYRFITTMFEEIILTQRNVICELFFETLEMILSNGSLYVQNESSVWEIIVEWTKKDPPKRLCYVPQFLTCLPYKELDEQLSLNILQNEIVSQNPFTKELQELKSSARFVNNFDILSQFLENRSNSFKDSDGYRTPSYLHVIARSDSENSEITNLFTTYDENLDLWWKIGAIDFQPDFLEVVGHHVYLFDCDGTFMKFHMISNQRVQMQNFTFSEICSLCHINKYLYVIGKVRGAFIATDVFEVYDTLRDTWFEMRSLLHINDARIVTLGGYIYMIGFTISNLDYGIIIQVFDYVNLEWSQLSHPFTDMASFHLVAYRSKIYLFGKPSLFEDITKMYVFQPDKNSWEDPITLPYSYSSVRAVVINNSLIVYDDFVFATTINSIRWNEAKDKWEELEQNLALTDFRKCLFTTVDDLNTIRIITKEMRSPETKLEKSSLN